MRKLSRFSYISWNFYLNWLTFLEAMKKIKRIFFPFTVHTNAIFFSHTPKITSTVPYPKAYISQNGHKNVFKTLVEIKKN